MDDIYTCEKSLTCDAKVTQLIELRNGRIVMTVTFTCGTQTDPVRDLVLSGHKRGVVAVCQLVNGVICRTGGDRTTIRAWNVLNSKSYHRELQ